VHVGIRMDSFCTANDKAVFLAQQFQVLVWDWVGSGYGCLFS
jgi:hypothetical protein